MPPADPDQPLVSIVTPTYRRADMLRRAVESVFAQTYHNWELIVSDDEQPAGETWTYLQKLAENDGRVRIMRNSGEHGQVSNINLAMTAARGQWIKPLYDDDVLKPDCLAVFIKGVASQPQVAIGACLTDRFVNGELAKPAKLGRRAAVELIQHEQAQLAMYLQDVEIGLPSQVMVRRDCIDKGVLFENVNGIACGIDTWWYARLLEHGDLLLINRPLVEEHQGEHETLTSATSQEAFDEELIAFRRMIHPMINPKLLPMPLNVIEQSLRLNRAIHRLYQRKPLEALGMMMHVYHPRAWGLALNWLLRRLFPGAFQLVPRVVVQP